MPRGAAVKTEMPADDSDESDKSDESSSTSSQSGAPSPRSVSVEPPSEATAPAINRRGKRRSKAPRRLRTLKDYSRFDRPDMYVNDLFPYMGMFLGPDGSRNNGRIPAFQMDKKCKVLRLSVEGQRERL